jgi:hypothetical protein
LGFKKFCLTFTFSKTEVLDHLVNAPFHQACFSTSSSLCIFSQTEQLGYSVAQMELAKPAPLSHLLSCETCLHNGQNICRFEMPTKWEKKLELLFFMNVRFSSFVYLLPSTK